MAGIGQDYLMRALTSGQRRIRHAMPITLAPDRSTILQVEHTVDELNWPTSWEAELIKYATGHMLVVNGKHYTTARKVIDFMRTKHDGDQGPAPCG